MQFNPSQRLLLGMVGWWRPQWVQGYYPPDLPQEWRLAYYANDCDCTLLNAEDWCDADPEGLAQAIDEAPEHLQFFLHLPAGRPAGACPNLALFDGRPCVLLTDTLHADDSGLPQWRAARAGEWRDRHSGAGLECWSLDGFDLRDLRRRADALAPATVALVLDARDASPADIRELRTMLQLMGRA